VSSARESFGSDWSLTWRLARDLASQSPPYPLTVAWSDGALDFVEGVGTATSSETGLLAALYAALYLSNCNHILILKIIRNCWNNLQCDSKSSEHQSDRLLSNCW
jgi:hypothetical protein